MKTFYLTITTIKSVRFANSLETGKNNEVVNFYHTISAQETKQTDKQSNLLILTVSCENSNCLIRSKKKKQNKTNEKTKQQKG